MCLHLANEEVFGFLEARCYLTKISLNVLLLFLKTLNILLNLIDTNLQSIILCILVIHSQEFLIVLLEIVLPLFVRELILSYLDKILMLWLFLLLTSDHISTLNHFACAFSQELPGEEPPQQDERTKLGLF